MLKLAIDPPTFVYVNYENMDHYIFGYINETKRDYECMMCGKEGNTLDDIPYCTRIIHTFIDNFEFDFLFCSLECGENFNNLITPVLNNFIDGVVDLIKAGMENVQN